MNLINIGAKTKSIALITLIYSVILVGEPDTKYMWILSRSQQPQPEVVQEYLDYAESIGYDLSDVIKTK